MRMGFDQRDIGAGWGLQFVTTNPLLRAVTKQAKPQHPEGETYTSSPEGCRGDLTSAADKADSLGRT